MSITPIAPGQLELFVGLRATALLNTAREAHQLGTDPCGTAVLAQVRAIEHCTASITGLLELHTFALFCELGDGEPARIEAIINKAWFELLELGQQLRWAMSIAGAVQTMRERDAGERRA